VSASSPGPIIKQRQQAALRRRSLGTGNRLVYYGILALLLFGPLAFGAVQPWAVFVIDAGAAVLFLMWAGQQLSSPTIEIKGNPLFAPMISFGVVAIIQLIGGFTVYRYATKSHALLYLAFGGLCFLMVQCLRRTWQVKTMAAILTGYGALVALFALLQSISANGKLYWVRTPSAGGWIYGPYVNHNHYAGLMEMLAPVALVVALSHYSRGMAKLAASFAAALMASTIFLSGSRGGMVAFVVQMTLLAAILLRSRTSKRTILAAGVFAALTLGMLTWIGGTELMERMSTLHTSAHAELSSGTRLAIDRDSWRAFLHRPVLGWGLGTFADIYPQFRSFYSNFVVNEAHNDYLQLLVETGAAGFATMLWFLLITYREALRKLARWPADINGSIALATVLGITGILVHGLVDFNLQVPANAALFYVFCSIAAMEPRFGMASGVATADSYLAMSTDSSG